MSRPPVEVFAAIESAAELRCILDHADLSTPGVRMWASREAALLQHWASLVAHDHEHARLAGGLDAFADYVTGLLSHAADLDEPG